jgi:hypothetical protein
LLDEERMERIRDTVAEIVDDLSTHRDTGEAEDKDQTEDEEESPLARLRDVEAGDAEKPLPPQWRTGKPVLCMPGPSLLDEAAATVLAQLLEKKGIGARTEEAGALSMSRIFALELDGVALICLCYVEHATPAQIHYAIRRVRRRAPDMDILVALFSNVEMLEDEDGSRGIYFAHRLLREAVDNVQAIASRKSETQPSPPLARDAYMAK